MKKYKTMTKEEFAALTKIMKSVYTKDSFLPNKESLTVWYEMLKDIPYQVANVAIQKYICEEKFPPTVADIREKVAEITAPKKMAMSESEAWAKVTDALYNIRYPKESNWEYVDMGEKISPSKREFNALPRVCQMAIGSKDILYKWAYLDDSTLQSVIMSNFLRSYRSAMEQAKKEAMLTPGVREMIEQARPQPQLPKTDTEDCESYPDCWTLKDIEVTSDFEDNERIEAGLENLHQNYPKTVFVAQVYHKAYIKVLNRYKYLEDGISKIQTVAESYARYKRRKDWNIQDLGAFLGEYARHEREYEAGDYDETDSNLATNY